MDNLYRLEISKLIKKYEYLKLEYEYQSELSKSININFMNEVNSFLSKNEELKSLYNEKVEILDSNKDTTFDNKIEKKDIDPKIVNLYRKIVKIAHPDKTQNYSLNSIYLEATKYYEENDIIGIYGICDLFSIYYDISDDEVDLIKEKIDILEKNISFLKENILLRWNDLNDSSKNKILLGYIGSRILNTKI